MLTIRETVPASGISFAFSSGMTTGLNLVFQYRRLLGACEAGAGVSFDDIELIGAVEALFTVPAPASRTLRWRDRPLLGTQPANLSALLRGKKVNDEVEVIALGPEGLICTRAPYMDEGETFEIVFEDHQQGLSYRFHGKVIWAEETEDGELEVELAFTGTPVLVRYGDGATRPATHGDAVKPKAKAKAVIVDESRVLTASAA